MQRCSKTNLAYRLRLHVAIREPNPFPHTSCNNVFLYSVTQTIALDFMQRCPKIQDLAYRLRRHAAICEHNPWPHSSSSHASSITVVFILQMGE